MSRKKLLENWQGEVAVGTLGLEPKIVYSLHVPQFCSSIRYILSRARASADMDSACKIYPPTMPKVYTDLTSSESDC